MLKVENWETDQDTKTPKGSQAQGAARAHRPQAGRLLEGVAPTTRRATSGTMPLPQPPLPLP